MVTNLENLKIYLKIDASDTDEDELLSLLLSQADAKIVKKRYPFGATDEQKALALTAYSDIELDIAVFLYSKMGAEGEKSHSENGISRGYEKAEDYLSGIVSVCKISSNIPIAPVEIIEPIEPIV